MVWCGVVWCGVVWCGVVWCVCVCWRGGRVHFCSREPHVAKACYPPLTAASLTSWSSVLCPPPIDPGPLPSPRQIFWECMRTIIDDGLRETDLVCVVGLCPYQLWTSTPLPSLAHSPHLPHSPTETAPSTPGVPLRTCSPRLSPKCSTVHRGFFKSIRWQKGVLMPAFVKVRQGYTEIAARGSDWVSGVGDILGVTSPSP